MNDPPKKLSSKTDINGNILSQSNPTLIRSSYPSSSSSPSIPFDSSLSSSGGKKKRQFAEAFTNALINIPDDTPSLSILNTTKSTSTNYSNTEGNGSPSSSRSRQSNLFLPDSTNSNQKQPFYQQDAEQSHSKSTDTNSINNDETSQDKLKLWTKTLISCAATAGESILSSAISITKSLTDYVNTVYNEQKLEQEISRSKRRKIDANLPSRNVHSSSSDSSSFSFETPGSLPFESPKVNNSSSLPTNSSWSNYKISSPGQPLVKSSSNVSDLLYHSQSPSKPLLTNKDSSTSSYSNMNTTNPIPNTVNRPFNKFTRNINSSVSYLGSPMALDSPSSMRTPMPLRYSQQSPSSFQFSSPFPDSNSNASNTLSMYSSNSGNPFQPSYTNNRHNKLISSRPTTVDSETSFYPPFLAERTREKYQESLQFNRFLEGLRRHRLSTQNVNNKNRPMTSSSSSSLISRNSKNTTEPQGFKSPSLQRSPNSGTPMMTKVGGGNSFSRNGYRQQQQQYPSNNIFSPFGTPADNRNLTPSFFPHQNIESPSASQKILTTPGVMRAFKFDKNRLQRRRPIVPYSYTWYYTHPRIELPEDAPSTEIYTQAYFRIIEERERMQVEIERLKREQEKVRKEKEELEAAEKEKAQLEALKAAAAASADTVYPLDPEGQNEVATIWRIQNPRQEIVNGFRITITAHDANTLRRGQWLNDNIIDFYLSMVTERSRNNGGKLPSSFVFSTHFYTKLHQDGYTGVKKWAKRKGVDVTKVDYIFVPINRHNTHWCLAVINNRDLRFEFYDSMNGHGVTALHDLKDYMIQQTMEMYPQSDANDLGYDQYEMHDSLPCPQQENAFDCGVFVCKMVEVLSRDRPLNTFSQKDMPNIRQRMLYEIIHQHLSN